MNKAIKVVVVDDEWEIENPLLTGDEWSRFAFSGVIQFSVDAVLQTVVRDNPSILLLDIIHAGKERAGNDEAGIRLFKELGENETWKNLRGSVQIVFFSSEPSARRHALVGRARRVDVSGFVSKADLRAKKPKALRILRQAADLAKFYGECPEIADPELRALSDLVFSPNSHAMHEVWKKIVLAGRCREPVFISGETGAGKELVAKAVFEVCAKIYVGRTPGSCDFVPLNIASLPAEGNLQYIELFGAEKGSFTGSTEPRKGLFEIAGEKGTPPSTSMPPPGGTIFLDEIGDAAPIVQVALLRVLQESTITPLGGFNSGKANKKISFRLISASHSLLGNVKKGRFREDLYFRLNGIHIHMPPLRERKDDIGVLVTIFIAKLNKEYGKSGYEGNTNDESYVYMGFDWESKVISDVEKLVDELAQYDWPGNVRELEMFIRESYVSTVGNTFQLLSKELKRRIAEHEPVPQANVDQILEALRKAPLRLTEVAKKFTPSVAVQIYQSLSIGGRALDIDTAKQYFGSKANPASLKKWVDRQLENSQPQKSTNDQEEQNG